MKRKSLAWCLFRERYELYQEVVGMFSEALKILDENTVHYMMDEMQKDIDNKNEMIEELREQNEAQRQQNEEQRRQNEAQRQQNEEQRRQNEEQRRQIAELLDAFKQSQEEIAQLKKLIKN